jgi:predicted phage baseplate assembly protein
VIELTIAAPSHPSLVFHEISELEAAGGKHGFVVSSTLDMPPGVVDVDLYARDPIDLETVTVTAWHVPGSRQWALDETFYANQARSDLTTKPSAEPDPTAKPSARSVQLLSTAGLRKGSLLALFPDQDSDPEVVGIASIDPSTWSATLERPLSGVYDLARSFISGNVAKIVQGTVERSTIGSSDGSTASLRLPLHASPLLYVLRDSEPDPVPDVTVFVRTAADDTGGSPVQKWDRVDDFEGQGPTKRVWCLDIDPDGTAFVVFGDGKRGAIPPSGRDNIEVQVRLGSGADGNLKAGAINQLVTGNLAVKSTANLKAAAGGSAPDGAADAREEAFAHRLPADRVVSASDCVLAALGVSDVISAALDPAVPAKPAAPANPAPGKPPAPTIPAATAKPAVRDIPLRLVVAMKDRRDPTPEDIKAVHDRVTKTIPVTAKVSLDVVPAEQRAVHLVVEVRPANADVIDNVRKAFGTGPDGFFAAARWDIGEPLRLGAVYDALFHVAGVEHARVLWMADTPLPEGEPRTGLAPDVFDPGATGVVRCDNDPVDDPFGRLGTFRLQAPETDA